MKPNTLSKESRILRETIMEVVANQVRNNDPPEARQTLERLMGEGISEEDARIYIAQALCVEIWHAGVKNSEFNLERFVRNLENLPKEPQE